MKKNQISLKQQGRASLQFLGSLRSTASGDLRNKAKKRFEELKESKTLINSSKRSPNKTSGQWMRLINQADKLARNNSEYRFERFYQHHGGREVWTRGIVAVEELRKKIKKQWKEIDSNANKSNLILYFSLNL